MHFELMVADQESGERIDIGALHAGCLALSF